MSGNVSIRDLRNNSAAVLARVAHGETLTITRDGEPFASVTPLPRRPISVEELMARHAQLPPIDAAGLRADIDALIDPAL